MKSFKEFITENEEINNIKRESLKHRLDFFHDKNHKCTGYNDECGDTSAYIAKKLKRDHPSTRIVRGSYKGISHVWVEIPHKNIFIDGTYDQFHNRKKKVNVDKMKNYNKHGYHVGAYIDVDDQ